MASCASTMLYTESSRCERPAGIVGSTKKTDRKWLVERTLTTCAPSERRMGDVRVWHDTFSCHCG